MSIVAGKSTLADRSAYLPLEARLLRRRIAGLYEQTVTLYHAAAKEQRLLRRAGAAHDGNDVLLEAETWASDIVGYASYAARRVPVRYPAEALDSLRRLTLFDLAPVVTWYSQCGVEAPKTRLYLESMDHLRTLVIEYIERFDGMTTDQKSF